MRSSRSSSTSALEITNPISRYGSLPSSSSSSSTSLLSTSRWIASCPSGKRRQGSRPSLRNRLRQSTLRTSSASSQNNALRSRRRRFEENIIKNIVANHFVQVGNIIFLCVYLQEEEFNNIIPILNIAKFMIISSDVNKVKNKIAKIQDAKINFNDSVAHIEFKLIRDR